MAASDLSRGDADPVDDADTGNGETVHTDGTGTAQLEVLQEQLAYKDELVAELTARLEEAAEQLDRLQRSGVRAATTGGPALPGDLVDEQRQLTQELSSAVRDWQEMNAAVLLSQIDGRLRDLQEQLAGQPRLVSPGTPVPASGPTTAGSDAGEEESPDEGQISDAWEAMKARLLNGAEAPEHPESEETKPPAKSQPAGGQPAVPDAASSESAAAANGQVSEVAAPEPIDLDAADRDDLVMAVLARDDYITYLLQTLADTEQRMEHGVDWSQLGNAPEELTRQLQEELERITQRGRREELRLSLERARLSREQAKLDQLRAVLERQLRTPGAAKADEEHPEGGSSDADRKARWSRLFGAS